MREPYHWVTIGERALFCNYRGELFLLGRCCKTASIFLPSPLSRRTRSRIKRSSTFGISVIERTKRILASPPGFHADHPNFNLSLFSFHSLHALPNHQSLLTSHLSRCSDPPSPPARTTFKFSSTNSVIWIASSSAAVPSYPDTNGC